MENYTLYSHKMGFDDIAAKVKAAFPKGAITTGGEGGSKVLELYIKGGFLSLNKKITISYRERTHPSFNLEVVNCPVSKQMSGMSNYVASLPATNERVRELLWQKIQTINSECSFTVEPKLTDDMRALILQLADDYEVFMFATIPQGKSQVQQFLGPSMELLMDTQGNCGTTELKVQIQSEYFDRHTEASPEVEARKARTETLLEAKGVKVNKHLPYVVSEGDVQLRSVAAVVERTFALALVAAKGEGVEQARLDSARTEFAVNGFSPEELRIFESVELAEQDKINSIWRYEGLNVMLWALGIVNELTYPSDICNVSEIVGAVIGQSRPEFEAKVKLRGKAEILDELDKIYRIHWACVDARLKNEAPGGGLNGSVVYERHYALNWLTCYGDAEWDDVGTDT